MFGRKRDKKDRLLEKIVMGVVIGGAIGSVLGASTKNKKSISEEFAKDVESTKKVSRSLFRRFLSAIFRRKNRSENLKKIPNEMEADPTRQTKS